MTYFVHLVTFELNYPQVQSIVCVRVIAGHPLKRKGKQAKVVLILCDICIRFYFFIFLKDAKVN